MKNVIFMGTPDFAVASLQALIDSEYTVQAVFSQPDKMRGRSARLVPTPVKELAMAHQIPVYTPKKIRDDESYDILRSYAPDVIVVAAFGQIIPRRILELPAYGCLNVHASLLPAWRGAAPIQWSILNGDKESGVTIMQMGEGLDTGDILTQEVTALAEDETGGSLFDRLSETGASLLIRTMRMLAAGEISPVPQPAESTTPYASMIKKEMGQIDWTKSAEEIERLVRAMDPWPSAYTYINGKQMKVWKSLAESWADAPGGPGTIISVDGGVVRVLTGCGVLAVSELQLEGKKRMDAAAFLRGYDLREGMRFG